MIETYTVVAGLEAITKLLPKKTALVGFDNGTQDIAWVAFGGPSIKVEKKNLTIYYGSSEFDVPERATHMAVLGSAANQSLICHCHTEEDEE